MRGVAALCLVVVLVTASVARAQSPAPSQTSPGSSGLQFLTGYRARLGASHLDRNDKAYVWDARISGDIDLVNYGRGRVNFFGEYEVVLGNEIRAFDPNQSLYTLDLRATQRLGRNEFSGLLHHVSRHLSDRAKTQSVDWNQIGGEVQRTEPVGRIRMESRLRGAWTLRRTYVDYRWQIDGRLRLLRPITPRASLLAEGSIDFLGIDSTIARRNHQVGAYLEGGTRLAGTNGSLDLILAFERRIDADLLARGPKSWVMVGFRLLSP